MSEPDDGFVRTNDEANEVFGRLQQIVKGAVAGGDWLRGLTCSDASLRRPWGRTPVRELTEPFE